MKFAGTLLVLAGVLLTSSAQSGPRSQELAISRSRILLGDIAQVPQEAALIDLGKSPRPGASRTITEQEIRRAAKGAALDGVTLPAAITVTRRAKKFDKAALVEAAELALVNTVLPKGARLLSVTARRDAVVADGFDSTRVDIPRLPRKVGRFVTPATLRFVSEQEEVSSVLVEVALDLPEAAAVPDLRKGGKLAIVVVRGAVEVRASAVANQDADVGDLLMVTVSNSKRVLRARLLESAPAVAVEVE